MRIGDREWVSDAAKVVRDARRVIDREFAQHVLKDLRRMQRQRCGEEINPAKSVAN